MENKKSFHELPWGSQPGTRIRKKSLAIQILKGVALTSMVLIAASNPYFGINLVRAMKRSHDKKQWRKLQQSLRYLQSRGYVKILSKVVPFV